MKSRNIIFKGLFLSLLMVACWGCKDSIPEENSTIPSPLTNVSVSNIPGGVEVIYDQPMDKNVNLITAEYATDEGGREIKRFHIEQYKTGFALTGLTTTQRSLELYTVSHSGIRSESIFVEIDPLLSPSMAYLQDVLSSIDFVGIPGGVAFNFDNLENKELTFVIEVREDGAWKDFRSFDTDEQDGLFSLHDFDFTEYRVYVKYTDEDNLERSGSKVGSVQALEEIELDKSTWSTYQLLPNDNWQANFAGFELTKLWDKNLDMTTAPRFENKNLPLPHSFTIDLGADQELALSKIRIYQHSNFLANSYTQYNPKTMEVWGSNNPDLDGGWDSWTRITTCISKMPSGGPKNTADLAYLREGEVYNFPLFTPAYRYIRFKVLNTWEKNEGESTYIRLSEVTLYGVQAD